MADAPHFFGIRHHGPGCARSLVRAFDALQPDCVLIEGPPEGDALVAAAKGQNMQPPVALLGWCPDESGLAMYFPFAEFSPEWQALRWATARGVPVHFIDLPLVHKLALTKEQSPKEGNAEPQKQAAPEHPALERSDPLQWFAQAAGYADGESWWNHMIEERGDGEQLFAAIAEGMTTLRAELPPQDDPHEARLEALREAHMRQAIRAAMKAPHQRVAVVCGAWHLGGLQADTSTKADAALLKGLPKLKVQCTWVPWTHRHLARNSGYGAGITSPGWYQHLWQCAGDTRLRTVGWLARVARLMRERELDCSSAHLIEAARLADTLSALRGRPAPSLEELNEATRSVLTLGDDTVLRWIDDALVIGDCLGQVPADVPTVPLQRDLEQQQKTLRLKPETLQRTLDLDLRQPNDLARSHLLHRLRLLDIPWGELARVGRSTRGSFHEVWTLQWQPEFALRLIEANRWGQTMEAAATGCASERAQAAPDLPALAQLVDRVLLADLEAAIAPVATAFEHRCARSGDALQLLAALPPLANTYRYGNVRQTQTSLVSHVLDGLIVRAAIALPLACTAIDDTAAHTLRSKILDAHAAVNLRDDAQQQDTWQHALRQVAESHGSHPLLRGVATRLRLDAAAIDTTQAAQQLSLNLSAGNDAAHAAAWLEGFLNRNAQVLLHDAEVFSLVDHWLADLGSEHFNRVLPLVRRAFSAFSVGERRDLGARAVNGIAPNSTAAAAAPEWDAVRAILPLPLLRQILGVAA